MVVCKEIHSLFKAYKATTFIPTWFIMSNLSFLLNLIFRFFNSLQIVYVFVYCPPSYCWLCSCVFPRWPCVLSALSLTDPQTLSCSGTLAGWYCQTLLWHIPSMHPLLWTTVFTKSNLTHFWFWGTSVLLFLLFYFCIFFVLGFFWFPRQKGALGETGLAQPTAPPEC